MIFRNCDFSFLFPIIHSRTHIKIPTIDKLIPIPLFSVVTSTNKSHGNQTQTP